MWVFGKYRNLSRLLRHTSTALHLVDSLSISLWQGRWQALYFIYSYVPCCHFVYMPLVTNFFYLMNAVLFELQFTWWDLFLFLCMCRWKYMGLCACLLYRFQHFVFLLYFLPSYARVHLYFLTYVTYTVVPSQSRTS